MSKNLKITVSQLLSDSNTVSPSDDKHTIKKVTSLNSGEIEEKQKNKIDHKTLNVRVTKYKGMLKNFDSACNSLKTSFESMKYFQMDLLADDNELKSEELDTAVCLIYF